MFCEIYLQSAAHIITCSQISRSSILDPDFPVNLEILLIKIILFLTTTKVTSCSKITNAFKP